MKKDWTARGEKGRAYLHAKYEVSNSIFLLSMGTLNSIAQPSVLDAHFPSAGGVDHLRTHFAIGFPGGLLLISLRVGCVRGGCQSELTVGTRHHVRRGIGLCIRSQEGGGVELGRGVSTRLALLTSGVRGEGGHGSEIELGIVEGSFTRFGRGTGGVLSVEAWGVAHGGDVRDGWRSTCCSYSRGNWDSRLNRDVDLLFDVVGCAIH